MTKRARLAAVNSSRALRHVYHVKCGLQCIVSLLVAFIRSWRLTPRLTLRRRQTP